MCQHEPRQYTAVSALRKEWFRILTVDPIADIDEIHLAPYHRRDRPLHIVPLILQEI